MSEKEWDLEVKPSTIYKHALDAKKKVDDLEKKIEKLTEAVVTLSQAINTSVTSTNPTPTSTALKPGRMIINVLHEDEDEVVKEVICPHCGTRDVVREVPKKIKVEVPREVIPEGFIPAPRTTRELLNLLESTVYHDGKKVLEKPEAVQQLSELLKKYGYELRPANRK